MIDTIDMQPHQISSLTNLPYQLEYMPVRVANLVKLRDIWAKSGLAGAIYLMLITHMDQDGFARITRKYIGEHLHASLMGIGRAIDILVGHGMINIHKIGRNRIYEILP